jgi:phosphoglycerate dehydrogenase-like enzyme
MRPNVGVITFGRAGLSDRDLGRVHFFVPPYEMQAEVAATLPKMRALEVVQTITSGIDWLPTSIPRGAVICNASSALSDSVAEWIVAAILLHVKRFPRFLRQQAESRWEQKGVSELAGKTVMILGHGAIGRALERRLGSFDVKFIRITRTERSGTIPLERSRERLNQVDILVVLLPLTEETRGVVHAEFLGGLRDGTLVINAARGSIVDIAALTAELRRRRLSAVLDVTDPEPLPSDHPLWRTPNVVITPHIASETAGSEHRAYELVWTQLRRYLSGEELENVVTAAICSPGQRDRGSLRERDRPRPD